METIQEKVLDLVKNWEQGELVSLIAEEWIQLIPQHVLEELYARCAPT